MRNDDMADCLMILLKVSEDELIRKLNDTDIYSNSYSYLYLMAFYPPKMVLLLSFIQKKRCTQREFKRIVLNKTLTN